MKASQKRMVTTMDTNHEMDTPINTVHERMKATT
jgi:hypothetical protein